MPASVLSGKLLGRMAQGPTHRFVGEHVLSLCVERSAVSVGAESSQGLQ
jgi:hypothetical protein